MSDPDPDPTSGDAGPERRVGGGVRGLARWAPVAVMAAVLLVVDQLTKARAFDTLCTVPNGYGCDVFADPVHVIGTLQWNLAFNTGMAFSKGSNSGPIIGSVALLIVLVLLFVARKLTSRLQLVLVGIVIGGALGNVVDRLFRAESGFMSGGVVDFIDLQWWPVFNVADAAVVVGGIALALTGFTTEADSEPEPDPDTEPPGPEAHDAQVDRVEDAPAPHHPA